MVIFGMAIMIVSLGCGKKSTVAAASGVASEVATPAKSQAGFLNPNFPKIP